jgi:hypothetical protein
MVQRFAAIPCGLNRDRQIFFDFSLSNKFAQSLRPQFQLKRRIVFDRRRRDQPLAFIGEIGCIPDRGHWPDSTTKGLSKS